MQDRITRLASMAMTHFKFSHQRKTQKVKMRCTQLINKYSLIFFLIIVAIAESQKHRDYTEHSHANETWVWYQKIQNKA